MADQAIPRSIGKCGISGRVIEEDEVFYTAILDAADGGEGFERQDFSAEAWTGPPEGTLCHFQTRLQKKDEPKKTFVDDDVMINFFLRLADAEAGLKQRFRFVLSLILMRKRILKYVKTIREGDREYWEMRLMRDKSHHRVFNPVLAEDEIEELSGELSAILHGHVVEVDKAPTDAEADADDPGTDEPGADEPGEEESAAEPAAAATDDAAE